MLRSCLLAGAACLPLLIAAPAMSQDRDPSADTVQRTPSWTGADIIVTGQRQNYAVPDTSAATKTNTPLIDVPQSVQVINKTLIEEQDRRTLADALVNVAGVTPTRSEEVLFTAPIIHGFPAEIYQDGLPFYGATQASNDPTSLVGIERIDVLKGPTSSLYAGGVGTPLGGLINIESVRPWLAGVSGFAAIRAGSFGTVDPYGDLNVPLSGTIAARITGEYQHNDSYIDQLHGYRWSIQPSLLFQLGASTDLFVQGKIDRRSQLEYSGIPAAQALAGQIDRNAFSGCVKRPAQQYDRQQAGDRHPGAQLQRHREADGQRTLLQRRQQRERRLRLWRPVPTPIQQRRPPTRCSRFSSTTRPARAPSTRTSGQDRHSGRPA